MTKRLLLLLAPLSGCAPAIITASEWDSGLTGPVQTRCVRVDMRDQLEMDSYFARFDGWKIIYLSEYTTSNRFGTVAAVCFEKALSASALPDGS